MKHFLKKLFQIIKKTFIIPSCALWTDVTCTKTLSSTEILAYSERKIFLNIWNKWTQISLVKRILVGLVVGAILGMVIPTVTVIGILGDLFVGALKALAPLLVFFIVMNVLYWHRFFFLSIETYEF